MKDWQSLVAVEREREREREITSSNNWKIIFDTSNTQNINRILLKDI